MPFKVKAYRFPLWWTYNSEWQPHISLWKKIQQRETARTDSFNQAKIHFINDQRIRVILPSSNNEKYELLEVINDRGFSYYYHLLSTTKVLQNDAREYIGVLNIYMTYVSQLGSAELAKVKCRVKRFLNNYLFTHYYMKGEYWRLPDEMFDYKNEPYGLAYDDSFMFNQQNPILAILDQQAGGNWQYRSYLQDRDKRYNYRILIPQNVGDIAKTRDAHNNILIPYNMGEDFYGPVVKKDLVGYTISLITPAFFVVQPQRTKVVVYQMTGIQGIAEGTYACFVVIDDTNDQYKNPEGLDNEYTARYKYWGHWIATKVDDSWNNFGWLIESQKSHVLNYNEQASKTVPPDGKKWTTGYSMFLPAIPKLSFFINVMNNSQIGVNRPGVWASPYWTNKLVGVYDLPVTKLLQMKDIVFYGMKKINNRGNADQPSFESYDVSTRVLFVPTFLISPSEFKTLTDTTKPITSAVSMQYPRYYDRSGNSPLMYKGLNDGEVLDYRTSYTMTYLQIANLKEGVVPEGNCDSPEVYEKLKTPLIENQFVVLPYPELEPGKKKLNVYCMSRAIVGGIPTSPFYRWEMYDYYREYRAGEKKLTWIHTINFGRGVGGGQSWLSFNGNKFISSIINNDMNVSLWESRGTNPVATSSYNEYIQSVRSQVNTGIRVAQEQRDFAIKKADIQGGIGIASGILGVAAGIGTAVATGGVGGWGSMSGGLGGIASSAADMELSKEQARMSYRHTEQQLAAQMADKYNSSIAQNIIPSDVQDVYKNLINNTNIGTFGYTWLAPDLVFNYSQSINPDPKYNIVEMGEGWFCWGTEMTTSDWTGYAWVSFKNEQEIKWPLWTEVTQFPQTRIAVDHYERLLWKVGMKGEFIAPMSAVITDQYREGQLWDYNWRLPLEDINKPWRYSINNNLGTYTYWIGKSCYKDNELNSFDCKFHYVQCDVDRNGLKNALWSSNINAPQPEWLVDAICELYESGVRVWYLEPTFDNNDRFMINNGVVFRELGVNDGAPVRSGSNQYEEGGVCVCSSISNDSTTSTRSTRKQKSRR